MDGVDENVSHTSAAAPWWRRRRKADLDLPIVFVSRWGEGLHAEEHRGREGGTVACVNDAAQFCAASRLMCGSKLKTFHQQSEHIDTPT